jgi:hypothetical protein
MNERELFTMACFEKLAVFDTKKSRKGLAEHKLWDEPWVSEYSKSDRNWVKRGLRQDEKRFAEAKKDNAKKALVGLQRDKYLSRAKTEAEKKKIRKRYGRLLSTLQGIDEDSSAGEATKPKKKAPRPKTPGQRKTEAKKDGDSGDLYRNIGIGAGAAAGAAALSYGGYKLYKYLKKRKKRKAGRK